MPYRNKELRDSARGEECTINIPGVCNRDPETTVLAHYGEPGEKGTGIKPDDTSGAFACSACHDVLDGRSKNPFVEGTCEKNWYWFRGMRRTWKRWAEMGIQL